MATDWTTTPQDDRDTLLDAEKLRAMAHPVRVRLVTLLRAHGPSTASRLAVELGLNSGATSYHLRRLAAAGMVVEDEGLGTGRDRWWRAAFRTSYLEPSQVGQTDMDTVVGYLTAVATGYADAMMRSVQEFPDLEPDWVRAWTISDFRLQLTADEGARLLEELQAVVGRYRRHHDVQTGETTAPAGARPVHVQLQTLPGSAP